MILPIHGIYAGISSVDALRMPLLAALEVPNGLRTVHIQFTCTSDLRNLNF